ncbi:sodium-translocating pyrophosphatase [Ruminococcaceae bacterium OttesenSCG-928-O06]|nr:sodium-translocating pyrophosphatase [Ruminococcaceae bacterium OttesenSCG-928-O06]
MSTTLALVAGVSILALLVALGLSRWINKQDPGTERMIEIGTYIREGAMAFLTREYRIIVIFAVVLFAILAIFINISTALAFLLGAVLSVLAGFCGMRVATSANTRTANAARTGGMRDALKVAFRGGSVMGLCVVGFGMFGVSLLLLVLGVEQADVLTGFSLGASSIALFGRVGGGIYTKAADMGADLVGKVEVGIPEDDPRNPAVIADNVGDNVGDVAGMGSDLFESYVGSVVSCIILAATMTEISPINGVLFPMLLAGAGILASILGIVLVGRSSGKDPAKALNMGTYVSSAIVLVVALALSYWLFGDLRAFGAVALGIVVGVAIGAITERYTSDAYKSVRDIAAQAETGAAVVVVNGFATGMMSTVAPILLICAAVGGAFLCFGLYGIALSAVGMLSTVGIVVAVDTYGPISDNAGGIAEMAHLPDDVREITDKLDSVGNTTAAIGKGFAIGSAALTALALFVSYAQVAGITTIDMLQPTVVIGMFIGGMLPFLFSALTMKSVGKAAFQMIEEVRRQFREKPGIMDDTEKPDYARCVDISTSAALKEMIIPGLLAVVAPLAVGLGLGVEALGGLLGGALVTGVLLAITMSTAGGAWDNAKKYIEGGAHGGKGSPAHEAAVIGDTVGDPFKDTSGPSINILIKLMTVVSLVFLPLFL